MESCGHYRRWQEDFALVEEMGIGYLRFGPPIHKTWLGAGKYDWEFADQTFADLKRRNIVPIVDLCHSGIQDAERKPGSFVMIVKLHLVITHGERKVAR
jgi:beta-glucosidase